MTPAAELALIGAAESTWLRTALAGWAARGLGLLKSLGPYAAIELLLPGGSVLALVLWLYRRHRRTLAERAGSASGGHVMEASPTMPHAYSIPCGKVLPEGEQ